MAWTAPHTWSVGEVLTAANMNTFLRDDMLYLYNASPLGIYRKTTAKTVNNTVTETDLLNGEITVGAGALGTSGLARVTMWGDWLQNSGGPQTSPRFKLKLGAGATVVLDTNTLGAAAVASTTNRYVWRAVTEVMNVGATNAQFASLTLLIGLDAAGTNAAQLFVTGEGLFVYAAPGGVGTSANATAEGLNTAAIDTTASTALQFTVINPVANPSVETKLLGALVEISASS